MKKFYTLAAAALMGAFSFTGMASAPVANGSEASLARLNPQNLSISIEKVEPLNGHSAQGAKKVQEKAGNELWTSIGTGIYRECIMSYLFDIPVQEIPVEIEKNNKYPGTYRLLSPYANFQTPYTNLQYDIMDEHDMIIHTETVNGVDYIWMEDFSTGMYFNDGENGETEIKIETQVAGLLNKMTPEQVVDQFNDAFGYIEDEVVKYPSMLVRKADNSQFANFLVIAYGQIQGMVNTPLNPFYIVFPDGEMPSPPNPFEVYTYLGEGEFLNNILPALLQENDEDYLKPVKVEIYEDPIMKGILHVRNAWDGWVASAEAEQDFEINATDPDYIYIPYQSTGYNDYEYGTIWVTDLINFVSTENNIPVETLIEQYPASVSKIDKENRMILFAPDGTVGLYQGENGTYALLPDINYAFVGYMTLPDEFFDRNAGVNGIVGDQEFDGPVKYYNLQGVEVANPEKGQLVIKRQGSKTTKMIVR